MKSLFWEVVEYNSPQDKGIIIARFLHKNDARLFKESVEKERYDLGFQFRVRAIARTYL